MVGCQSVLFKTNVYLLCGLFSSGDVLPSSRRQPNIRGSAHKTPMNELFKDPLHNTMRTSWFRPWPNRLPICNASTLYKMYIEGQTLHLQARQARTSSEMLMNELEQLRYDKVQTVNVVEAMRRDMAQVQHDLYVANELNAQLQRDVSAVKDDQVSTSQVLYV